MIYRMALSNLTEVKKIDDLNGKVSTHYIECLLCNAYKRLSYDLGIAQAALFAHMFYIHGVQMDNTEEKVKNIGYKIMAMDKHTYPFLHDLVIVDPQ